MYKDKSKEKEYRKKYGEENKEKIKEYEKFYYEKNKDKINKSKNEKYSNSDEEKDRRKKFSKENRHKINKYRKEYFQKNKDKYRKYKKDRMNRDPLFKLSLMTSSLIRNSIKRMGYTKKGKTYKILGCSFEEFKIHMESQFKEWMTWENHGIIELGIIDIGWDIDHIIPISSAETEEDIIRLNHYTNLQPLCSYTNRYIKKDLPEFYIPL